MVIVQDPTNKLSAAPHQRRNDRWCANLPGFDSRHIFCNFPSPPQKKKKLCSKITIGSKYNDTKIIQSSYGHPKLLNLQSVSIAYRGIEKYHNWTIPQCYVVRI